MIFNLLIILSNRYSMCLTFYVDTFYVDTFYGKDILGLNRFYVKSFHVL